MPKIVYLAGAFEENEYRLRCKNDYSNLFDLIDPINDSSKEILENNRIRRDNTNGENRKLIIPPDIGKLIVETDKELIDSCDLLIAYVNRPTFGTIMEVCYAFENCKPIYGINPNGEHKNDVWFRYHCDKIFESIEECFEYLKNHEID